MRTKQVIAGADTLVIGEAEVYKNGVLARTYRLVCAPPHNGLPARFLLVNTSFGQDTVLHDLPAGPANYRRLCTALAEILDEARGNNAEMRVRRAEWLTRGYTDMMQEIAEVGAPLFAPKLKGLADWLLAQATGVSGTMPGVAPALAQCQGAGTFAFDVGVTP